MKKGIALMIVLMLTGGGAGGLCGHRRDGKPGRAADCGHEFSLL